MSTLWSGFKAAWSRSHGNLTIWTALAGIKRCVEAGNTPKNALAGWAHCGWVPGECLQRQVVLSERAAELFHSKKGQPLQPMKSQASSALSLVAEVAPAKRKCTRANCKGTVTVTDKYCPHCGNENQHFDNKAHQAYYGARSGWYRQEDEPQVSAETPAEKELAGGIGDLFKTLRKRQVHAAPEGATAPANPATRPLCMLQQLLQPLRLCLLRPHLQREVPRWKRKWKNQQPKKQRPLLMPKQWNLTLGTQTTSKHTFCITFMLANMTVSDLWPSFLSKR